MSWFRPNLWHEFQGDPRTAFSSETGFIPFRADLGGSWVELNTGIGAQIDRTTSFYANASYQIGLDGDSSAWDGKNWRQGQLVRWASLGSVIPAVPEAAWQRFLDALHEALHS